MGSKRLDCLDCDACQIDQLKHGIDSCQTQIDALNRSMGELVGRLGSFDTRLDKLEGELPSGTTAVQEARKVARFEAVTAAAIKERIELKDRLKKLEAAFRVGLSKQPSVVAAHDGPTPELLQALRAAGVTRYQDGELVIELGPAAAPGLAVAPPDEPAPPGQLALKAEMVHRVAQLLRMPDAADGEVLAAALNFVLSERGSFKDTRPLDSDKPDDVESASGFGIDHDALAAKLEERARAMERPAK